MSKKSLIAMSNDKLKFIVNELEESVYYFFLLLLAELRI